MSGYCPLHNASFEDKTFIFSCLGQFTPIVILLVFSLNSLLYWYALPKGKINPNATAVGAIIGAAIGRTAGALIGRHMDNPAEELRQDLEGATVEREGEGIKITFDSGLLFAVDSYAVNVTSGENAAKPSGRSCNLC